MSEEDCFKKYLSLITKVFHVQWLSQHEFILDENDKLMVDFVGRFESFDKDVYLIIDKLKTGQEIIAFGSKIIPHLNKSNHMHYSEYYDSESKEVVWDLYEKGIERFQYTF